MLNFHDNKLIDGKAIGNSILAEINNEIQEHHRKHFSPPGLAVLLIGNRKDSETYVRMKIKACKETGIVSNVIHFPENVSQEKILDKLRALSGDYLTDGILVQLPLPPHLNEQEILEAVPIEKDVDGFHAMNIAKLALRGHEPHFLACTPKGCLELLKRSNIEIAGKHVVILGRSNIVGMPLSLMMLREDATVTICHSKSQNVPSITNTADILISSMGKARYVKKDWIKPGAVIIDVGINYEPDTTKQSGYRLVGDVDEKAYDIASKYTPVPGGVGPMTVAMLMQNTMVSARRRYAQTSEYN